MVWQVNLPYKELTEKEHLLSLLSLSNTSGIWEKESELIAYFEGEDDLENFTKLLQDHNFFIEKVKEAIDWNALWKRHHKVIKIKPFIITPPFLEKRVKISPPYRYKIVINPSMAFGTGSHATTKLCIKYLAKSIKKGDTVLDMGTGTGILAIASEKLGAKCIWGIDIDEIALKEAEKNLKRNGCHRISLSASITSIKDITFDIIVCNIILKDILELKEFFEKVLKKGGILILSGLLKEQKDEAISYYRTSFNYKNSLVMKDKNFYWIVLKFIKP